MLQYIPVITRCNKTLYYIKHGSDTSIDDDDDDDDDEKEEEEEEWEEVDGGGCGDDLFSHWYWWRLYALANWVVIGSSNIVFDLFPIEHLLSTIFNENWA